jgi:transcriptional regulator with PAS, ATPase and Fis domain
MIVVMIIALAVSNVLLYGKEINVDEGFDSMDKIEQEQEHEEHEEHEKNESVEKKLNEIVNGKESMETKTTTKPTPLATTKPTTSSSKKPEPTPTQVEKAKADLKGLLELEVKLMQGVTEMQPLLEKAKDTIKSLNENIQSTKSAT